MPFRAQSRYECRTTLLEGEIMKKSYLARIVAVILVLGFLGGCAELGKPPAYEEAPTFPR
jgi:hypothetical protein